jgi:hypothetical protein
MANEKKDGLFETNLGDGFIEVPETKEKTVVANTEETVVKKDGDSTKKDEVETFKQHDDGTIEIDEALQATIAAQTKKEDDVSAKNIESEKNKKTPSDGDDSGDSSPSSSQYLAFARDRATEGVFLDFNDGDWKTLMERNDGDEAKALRELSDISMQQRITDGVEAYKESITDEDRALYEAKERGLPVDKYGKAKHELAKWSKVKSEDLKENEKLQIDVISKGFELRGFTKDEIAEEIENLKALEKLEIKAESILPLLPKKFKDEITNMEESATAEEASRKDNIRQGVARMKQFVDNTPEIIPGIKLTKPVRDKIMKSMTEPVGRDVDGNPVNPVVATKLRNPQAFETMVHYYHQLGLFNIDENGQMKPDFSKISKVAKVEATDGLRAMFESKETPVSGTVKVIQSQQEEEDDWDKAFKRI